MYGGCRRSFTVILGIIICKACCIINCSGSEDTLRSKQEYPSTNNNMSVKTRSNLIKHNTKYLILIGLVAVIGFARIEYYLEQ